ncbi:dimethylsulfoxide reductase subunit B [Vibrio sp. CAIM 722]|uniref:Dimethylsulfoxide reductase subunit B n=1 Tax=Vibrio eleionomae TaxID=2653505 RepID=A0A7X4LNP8_9VIBR|nr:DMSO/selenate family reductase complex B subunit [Vibrio eleionomae]MZI95007.1 dimethylsulfoxide reductase subunit B [Vibrio eleionomae]
MKQLGFYIDTSRCSGCKTCQVSCKDKNNIDVGRKYRRVYEYGGGTWEKQGNAWQNNTFAYYASISCNHCSNPTCVEGCPTGAMHKRDDNGVVLVNQDVCIGCRYCEMRCPYGAPQFDEEKGVISKCDFCLDRLEQGLNPVCVDSCPQRAIEFGDIDELRAKYGHEADIAPLPSSEFTHPNLVIKPHPKAVSNHEHQMGELQTLRK